MHYLESFWHLLLKRTPFLPHAQCLIFDPTLLSWSIIGQSMIVVAYFSIPAQLSYITYLIAWRKQRLAIRRSASLALLFALFIFMCGISHALDILVLWVPIYYLQTLEVTITGVVSCCTSFMLSFAVYPLNHDEEPPAKAFVLSSVA